MKIVMVGPSGVGKTTLAKDLAEKLSILFVSGSYSDLVPETKETKHKDMILADPRVIYIQDYELFVKRDQIFKEAGDNFISDRSFIDSIAYHLQKLSHQVDVNVSISFINELKKSIEENTTHIIYIPYTVSMIGNFEIEDNSKRILNPYYQVQISSLMTTTLTQILGFKFKEFKEDQCSFISYNNDKIKVLILLTSNYEERLKLALEFLSL